MLKLYNRLKTKGFIGPKYQGLTRHFKLLYQEIFGHYEIVSYAEPDSWQPQRTVNPEVKIKIFENFDSASVYLGQMENAYFKDYTSEWKNYFSWGHILALAFIEKKVAAFVWIQNGKISPNCYYIKLKEGEYRMINGGVLPGFRGKKVHTTRHILVIEYLFGIGAKRIYIDAFEDNVISWKGQKAAGYIELGRIFVKKSLFGKKYIRWL